MSDKKIALVTGASRGIGRGIAESLAQAGYEVIGTATSEAGAKVITDSFKEQALSVTGKVLDVADKASIESFFKDLEENNLMPSILINNAGITRDNLMLRMSEEEWEAVIETNLSSIFRMTRRCLKHMIKARFGRIVNISSISGVVGLAGQANYSAAKAGVLGMTKAIAKEVASRNITVNAIAPGFIQSDMTDSLSEAMKIKILSEIPMERIGTPEDIAEGVLFLIKAKYFTGQTLNINGGMCML